MTATNTTTTATTSAATATTTAATADTLAAQIEQTVEAAVMQPLTEKIDAWFRASFNGSVVSRDTEVFNYVRTAVDALKKELAA